MRTAAPPPASRALANIYLKAFSAIFHPFPCLPGKEWGTDFRDLFQFVTELLGRLRLGGYAPEYVARGEENDTSDVDLLVDYDKSGGLSLLTIVRYKLDMEQLIGREVDLVENGYLKPFAVESAEKDKYLIYER